MKELYLENTTGKSNKYYRMTELNNGKFRAEWGRINALNPLGTKDYQMVEWEATKKKKEKKGYIVV